MASEDRNDADTRDRLRSLIRLHGRLPASYRFTAWKYLLQLPGNASSFRDLVRKGPHPAAVASLAVRYPLRNCQLFRKLAVLNSVVAHWSSVLGEAEFVPAWLFPFVVVFQQVRSRVILKYKTLGKCWCYFNSATATVTFRDHALGRRPADLT